MIKGLEHLFFQGKAEVVQTEEKTVQGKLFTMQGCKEVKPEVFSLISGDKVRGKIKHKRLPLNIRKQFFTLRMPEHCNRLLRGVV